MYCVLFECAYCTVMVSCVVCVPKYMMLHYVRYYHLHVTVQCNTLALFLHSHSHLLSLTAFYISFISLSMNLTNY
jgi:hypothetical protein